jgi:hypothetical protein
MHLDKFVHTKSGKIIMSVILGFGLATLFRQVCKGKQCLIIKAPPMEEIEDKVYKYEDSCYQYHPQSTQCSKSTNLIKS